MARSGCVRTRSAGARGSGHGAGGAVCSRNVIIHDGVGRVKRGGRARGGFGGGHVEQ